MVAALEKWSTDGQLVHLLLTKRMTRPLPFLTSYRRSKWKIRQTELLFSRSREMRGGGNMLECPQARRKPANPGKRQDLPEPPGPVEVSNE